MTSPHLSLDVQTFLLDSQARNVSSGTLRYYAQKLYPLVSFLQGMGIGRAEEVTPNHLRTWLVHLQETGHNAGGVHAFYRAAKALFSWLAREEMIARSPMAHIRAPRVPEELLQPVTVEQVRALLAACDAKTEMGVRDRAIILCLWDSGCRASEFTALNLQDVTFETGAVFVRSGKGRKARVTFLGAKSRRELLRYLRLRGEVPPPAPLFATEDGRRLRYPGLRDVVRRRAKQDGIAPPSLHAFRRGFALHSLQQGADVYSLQKMMGHTSLVVLRRYLKQTEDDLRRVHDKTGPVDNLLT